MHWLILAELGGLCHDAAVRLTNVIFNRRKMRTKWGITLQASTTAIIKHASSTVMQAKKSLSLSQWPPVCKQLTTLTSSRRSTWSQLNCKLRRFRTWLSSCAPRWPNLLWMKKTWKTKMPRSRAESWYSAQSQSLSWQCPLTCRSLTWSTSSGTRRSSETLIFL